VGARRDLADSVKAVLLSHQRIREVELVGSRAAGTAVPLSDWDFRIEADDFATVAADLPRLASRLEPLAQQWDRLSPHHCYMLVLTGPAKVDLLFLDQPHQPEPPWTPSPGTLPGIDEHFWDWTLWLAAKHRAGRDRLVRDELEKMARHLLVPMGVPGSPDSLEAAVRSYRAARDRLEHRFGVAAPRRLEREVMRALSRG
jgi:predicted nucleotidyltransferase